jgi:hypothetical protein
MAATSGFLSRLSSLRYLDVRRMFQGAGAVQMGEHVARRESRFATSDCDTLSLEDLVALAETLALPVVRRALLQEAASTGAAELVAEATRFLNEALRDPDLLEELEEQDVRENLSACLSQTAEPPDGEEIEEHTRRFANMLARSWIEVLAAARNEGQTQLDPDGMLPLDFKLQRMFFDALSSFVVDEGDIRRIMAKLHIVLFRNREGVRLPLDVSLLRGSHLEPDPGRPESASEEAAVEQPRVRMRM